MMKRLSEVARAEGLGGWIVVVNTEKNLKELEPEILAILRDRRPRVKLLKDGRRRYEASHRLDRTVYRLRHGDLPAGVARLPDL
jgi:hypothetical protein